MVDKEKSRYIKHPKFVTGFRDLRPNTELGAKMELQSAMVKYESVTGFSIERYSDLLPHLSRDLSRAEGRKERIKVFKETSDMVWDVIYNKQAIKRDNAR